jgi:adenylylsulfate kinase
MSKGIFIQMTGLSGAGKTTLAHAVQERLLEHAVENIEIIDGDEYRAGLCSDLGFSKEDRNTNIRRLGFVGRVLARNGVVAIMSAINPYEEVR